MAIIIRSCPHSDFYLMSNFKSFFREALHSRFFEKEQMREFHAVKMVFEFHLESGSSVMPAISLFRHFSTRTECRSMPPRPDLLRKGISTHNQATSDLRK
jgi:hypothetical protein